VIHFRHGSEEEEQNEIHREIFEKGTRQQKAGSKTSHSNTSRFKAKGSGLVLATDL
jgi:hypothetical protein